MKTLRKISLILLSVFLLIPGCIPSVHPLYTQKDLVFDDEIIGLWKDQEGNQWDFREMKVSDQNELPYYQLNYSEKQLDYKKMKASDQIKSPSNKLIYSEKKSVSKLKVHLLQLGENYYVDFYPEDLPFDNTMTALHFFPVHTFAKFSKINQDTIEIQQFDVDYLQELIKENRVRIKHEKNKEDILLTASTEDLQKFVIKYANDQSFFEGNTTTLIKEN